MLRLNLDRGERWIDLLPGVRLRVRPMDNVVWLAARADDAVLTAATDETRASFVVFLACSVAQRLVTDWEGVGDADGVPIRPTPDAVAQLIRTHKAALEAFETQVLAPWFEVVAEGNALPPAPHGSLAAGVTAAAPFTATGATPAPAPIAPAA